MSSGAAPVDLTTPVPKVFRASTHRIVAPAETVARLTPVLPVLGITRLANVTGLDRIGVPVVVACRPNARSLSVSQGKGLDLDASRASALMESVEAWHAERITHPLKLGSYEDLRYTHDLVDVAGLPVLADSVFSPRLPLLWIEGFDLMSRSPRWVPYEVVHTNYTLPRPTGSGAFSPTSNGLASGNHLLEAISHGLCEVVERDATALWELGAGDPDERSVDLDAVADEPCRWVLERFRLAEVGVSVWETTSDVGIPVFTCLVTEGDDPLHPLHAAMGHGCHPVRAVALLRALTEAAQSRLTVITGSRDDVLPADYRRSRSPDTMAFARAFHDVGRGRRRLEDGPGLEAETFNDDLVWELERLAAVGIEQVVVVDLTRPDLRVPVVRVVVPGLDGVSQMGGYVPGRRGRAVLAAASRGGPTTGVVS
ncbi:MAG: YcaO-like family protein [Acidimicrobiales bacterium]|nr:YcaO-like family protein [Acidimicrobiales bacterium]